MCNVFGEEATALVGTAGQSESEDDRRIHSILLTARIQTAHSIVSVSSRVLWNTSNTYVHADICVLRRSRARLFLGRTHSPFIVVGGGGGEAAADRAALASSGSGRGAFPHLTLPPL